AFILACIPLLWQKRVRAAVFADSGAVLALIFGACSHIALLKTQASHYFFPGTPFLFMFAVSVYGAKLREIELSKSLILKFASVTAVAAVVLAASVVLYRPDAARRLTGVEDFAVQERDFRARIQSVVPSDRYLLVTGGELASTWTYWI